MLKAILHGKAGRIEHNKDESVSWSQLFKAREDLLTSTFFERFAYLSDGVQTHLIKHWFKAHSGEVPVCFGEFKSISYWPRFDHEHEQGFNQVEPDLIIHFDQCNILVEVKPPAGGDQYEWQWQKEIESFLQSEDGNKKPLYFLAIGRIEQKDAKKWANKLLPKFDTLQGVSALKWTVVTEHIVDLTSDENLNETLTIAKQDRRILLDILDGLSLYGLQVSPFKWSQFKPELLPELCLDHALLKSVGLNRVDNQVEPPLMRRLLEHDFLPLDVQSFQSYLNDIKD